MANKLWEGQERREHDDACKERTRALKEWVADKICIATKPTKGKMALLILLLGSTVALSGISVVNSLAVSGETKNNKESIRHNADANEKLEKKFDAHMYEQRVVNSAILDKLNEIGKQVVRIEEKVE